MMRCSVTSVRRYRKPKFILKFTANGIVPYVYQVKWSVKHTPDPWPRAKTELNLARNDIY